MLLLLFFILLLQANSCIAWKWARNFSNQKLNEAKLRDRIFFVFFSLLLLYLSLCWYFNVWIHFNSLAKRNAFYCFRAELFQVLGEKKFWIEISFSSYHFRLYLGQCLLVEEKCVVVQISDEFSSSHTQNVKTELKLNMGNAFLNFHIFHRRWLRMLLCVRWMRILPYARIFKASKISMVAHNGADP